MTATDVTSAAPTGGPAQSADPDTLLGLAERVAGWAAAGEQVEAYVARGRHTSVRVFDGDVESLSSADSEGVGIRVISGHRQGFAYAASLDEAVIAETFAEARDNAEFGTVDPYLGLPEPDGVRPVDLDLFHPELADFPAAAKVDLALELERATRAADSRIRGVESADYGDSIFQGAIASSTGVRASQQRTVCSLWSSALADDGTGTQTGSGYSVGRRPSDLDVAEAATDAAFRATRLLGAHKPPSQRLAVLLEPSVTASFLAVLSSALSGMAAIKGRSFLAGRLGEQVAVPFLTLVDDPTNGAAYGAAPFDAEGLASRQNVLIDGGVLRSFLHNTYTGRRRGQPSSANAVRGGFKTTPGVGCRALSLAPGQADQAQLLADMGEGLLVQSVTGLHSGANSTTGDFSVGVAGLMVRGGEIAEPVREATIASSLPRMLLGVVAVGSDREWLPGSVAGMSLVVADVTLSGS
ncbi:MAG: TldD/PmbA family protein [Actinobacteria bacterium]|nr:TldD/PmbA family protein [Actinomycetota bacterium]